MGDDEGAIVSRGGRQRHDGQPDPIGIGLRSAPIDPAVELGEEEIETLRERQAREVGGGEMIVGDVVESGEVDAGTESDFREQVAGTRSVAPGPWRAAGRETLQKGKSSEQASATNPASEET